MVRRKNPYGSEAELCDAFVESAKLSDWQAYPECGNWDLLMVRDGIQVGIEAKMRCSLEVVTQAMPKRSRYRAVPSPHYVGVLVPFTSPALNEVCSALKILTFDHSFMEVARMWQEHGAPSGHRPGDLRLDIKPEYVIEAPRIELPVVAVQTSGGRPSPKRMSKWRVSALRLCILLERRGDLSSQDFRSEKMDITRWRNGRWITRNGDVYRNDGKRGMWARYTKGDRYNISGPSVGYEPEMEAMKALPAG